MAQWIDAQGIVIDVTTLLAGKTAHNVMSYNPVDPTEFVDPADVAAWFATNVVAEWAACLSSSATLVNLAVSTNTGGGAPPYAPYTQPLVEVGGLEAAMLPPFVAARLYKVPDLSSAQPSQPDPAWRMGMVRIAGVPETRQQSGTIDATYIALLDTLCTALVGGTVGAVPIQMSMFRLIGATLYGVGIDHLTPGAILGTQNSRKT